MGSQDLVQVGKIRSSLASRRLSKSSGVASPIETVGKCLWAGLTRLFGPAKRTATGMSERRVVVVVERWRRGWRQHRRAIRLGEFLLLFLGGIEGRPVLEAGVLCHEREVHSPDWSVALFAEDDLRDAGCQRTGCLVPFNPVALGAVDERDDIRILLDRTRFAQVG